MLINYIISENMGFESFLQINTYVLAPRLSLIYDEDI